MIPYLVLVGIGKGATYVPIAPVFKEFFRKDYKAESPSEKDKTFDKKDED